MQNRIGISADIHPSDTSDPRRIDDTTLFLKERRFLSAGRAQDVPIARHGRSSD
jgi:hypothetical protein